MRVLVLAPHPFYQDRGTPIDVHLVLRVLAERPDTKADVVTYHEGEDVDLPDVRIFRSRGLSGFEGIRPGFSLKKVISDGLMFVKAWGLLQRNQYDVVHAGEEAVFFAMLFKRLYGIPFAYDLDSSIAQQLVEQKPHLQALSGAFDWMEGLAIRDSLINFPVCNALADLCRTNGSSKTVTLHDISQLKSPEEAERERLHRELVLEEETVFLYSGNLEEYQGIDLLLESFRIASHRRSDLALVIVGGEDDHIAHYRDKASRLAIGDSVKVVGATGKKIGLQLRGVAKRNSSLCSQRELFWTPPLIGKPSVPTPTDYGSSLDR